MEVELLLIESADHFLDLRTEYKRLECQITDTPNPQDLSYENRVETEALSRLIKPYGPHAKLLRTLQHDLERSTQGLGDALGIRLYKRRLRQRIYNLEADMKSLRGKIPAAKLHAEKQKVRQDFAQQLKQNNRLSQKLQGLDTAMRLEEHIFLHLERLQRTNVKQLTPDQKTLCDRSKLHRFLTKKILKTKPQRHKPTGAWTELVPRYALSLTQRVGLDRLKDRAAQQLQTDQHALLLAIAADPQARRVAEWRFGNNFETRLKLAQQGCHSPTLTRKKHSKASKHKKPTP